MARAPAFDSVEFVQAGTLEECEKLPDGCNVKQPIVYPRFHTGLCRYKGTSRRDHWTNTEVSGKSRDFHPNFVFNPSKMSTMKPRWIAFAIACMIAAGLVRTGAQAAKKPNFSGTWVLNMHKSKLGMPATPVGGIWVIQHSGSKFHLERTDIYRSGLHDKRSMDLVTDGKSEFVQHEGPYREATRMYWSGKSLVLDTKITTSADSGTTVIRYSLSSDRKTLTAIEHDKNPGGEWSSRWVFSREAKAGKTRVHPKRKAKPASTAEAKK